MRVSTFADSMDDLPPPPYTPHDPVSAAATAPVSPNVSAQPMQAPLRGGYMRPAPPSEMASEYSNFSSASTYFDDRVPSFPDGGRNLNLIEHNVTFSPDTTRDDLFFPLPIETYIARDVTSLDWSTFVNYLFPALDHSVNEKVGNEKGFHPRAFVEEDTPERRQRIKSVVAEWNEKFFSPRLIHVNAEFVSNSSRAIPTSAASNRNGPVPISRNEHPPNTLYRSNSYSSSSSSSSASSSSVDSIKSKDLEGADINGLRSALLAFRLDATKKDHLHQSVRQLRDEFCSQRRNLSYQDRKELKKEYKDQRKEVKKEAKALVKEIKATRKADRKLRKAGRKSRRHGKRAETRGIDRMCRAQEKAQRQQERAAEKANRAQARGLEAQERAAEQALRAHERAADSHERAREAQARETAAVASAQKQAANARSRAWDSENAARERAREIEQRAQAHQNLGASTAAAAVARAQEAASRHQSRNYGVDAVARAQETARQHQSRDWGAFGREQGRQAEQRGQRAAREAEGTGRDWGAYGRERGREAERNARGRVEEVTRGL